MHNRSPRILVTLAAAAILAASLRPPARSADSRSIFVLTDPRGDDHGDGKLIYPRRDDLRPGDLDLVSLEARALADGTEFEATFARPIQPTARRDDRHRGRIARRHRPIQLLHVQPRHLHRHRPRSRVGFRLHASGAQGGDRSRERLGEGDLPDPASGRSPPGPEADPDPLRPPRSEGAG